MTRNRSFQGLIFIVILGIGAALAYASYRISGNFASIWIAACAIVLAFIVSSAIQVADQWSKAVVLRLGKFHAPGGPGLFLIIPLIDTISVLDRHPRSYQLVQNGKNADPRTPSRRRDAVLFWKIVDPKKARST